MSKPTPYEMEFAHRAWWEAHEAGRSVPSLDAVLERCRATRTAASRFQEDPQHPRMPQSAPQTFETQKARDVRAAAVILCALGTALIVVGAIALSLALTLAH